MSYLDAVILGLVQGLTEFLPVSSSGHLVIGQRLLGVPAPGILLEVVLHAATLLSVVVVYRRRLAYLVAGAVRRDPEAWRYIGLLALATVPAVLVGLFLKDAVETAFDTPIVTGLMLLVTGAIVWSTRGTGGGESRLPGPALAAGIGLAQAFAILPGISRSGATIAAGLWGRVDGVRAAEFSFLMSIPAIAGAALLQLLDMDGAAEIGGPALGFGFLTALLAGVAAIRSLVWLVRRQRFHLFAYYVWGVGILFLLYLALGG